MDTGSGGLETRPGFSLVMPYSVSLSEIEFMEAGNLGPPLEIRYSWRRHFLIIFVNKNESLH